MRSSRPRRSTARGTPSRLVRTRFLKDLVASRVRVPNCDAWKPKSYPRWNYCYTIAAHGAARMTELRSHTSTRTSLSKKDARGRRFY